MKSIITKSVLLLLTVVFIASCGDPNIESAKLDLRNQNYEGVLESANKAIEADPNNALAYYYKGVAMGELTMKKPIDQRVPGFADTRVAYMKSIELGNEMEKVPAEVLLSDVRLAELWRIEVNEAFKLIAPEEAEPTQEGLAKSIHHLNNAITLEPDSTQTLTMYSYAYEMMGDIDNAVLYTEMLIEALVDNPDVDAYLRLAFFYSNAGEKDKAAELLNEARVIFPESIEVVQEQANNYLALGDMDSALRVVRELIDSDPENTQYRLVFGTQIYQLVLGMNDELRSSYDVYSENSRMLRMEERKARPDRALVEQLKSTIATAQSQIDALTAQIEDFTNQAETELLIASELDDQEPITFYTLGIIYLNKSAILFERRNATENLEEADKFDVQGRDMLRKSLPYFERAAELDPDDTDYWMQLFRIYTTLGMTEKAMEAQEKAGL
jgi:tetratricopeptide (TPR) repeat protein